MAPSGARAQVLVAAAREMAGYGASGAPEGIPRNETGKAGRDATGLTRKWVSQDSRFKPPLGLLLKLITEPGPTLNACEFTEGVIP